MKKYGFTIAESIITMAIIGVVAALTIPPLTTNYRKQAYTCTLSAAVSNFEKAMSTLILKEFKWFAEKYSLMFVCAFCVQRLFYIPLRIILCRIFCPLHLQVPEQYNICR